LELAAQQQLMAKPRPLSNTATISFFKIRNMIVKNCKLFTQRKFVKECFLEIADHIFEGLQIRK
jgi:hypothetical protein